VSPWGQGFVVGMLVGIVLGIFTAVTVVVLFDAWFGESE